MTSIFRLHRRHLMAGFIVAVLIVFSISLNATITFGQSATYYVSTTGSSSNSGTATGSPWPLAYALANAPSGSTINLLAGTYRVGDLTVDALITNLVIQNYNGASVTLLGSSVMTGWIADGNRWRLDNWIYAYPPPAFEGNAYIDPAYPMANYRDQVFFNSTPQVQVGNLGSLGAGKFFVDYAAQKLYVGSNPNGTTVEATTKNYGFIVEGPGTDFRGITFRHYADTPLYVVGPDVTIENCLMERNGVAGTRYWADNINLDVSGGIVRNTTMRYNGRKGMSGRYSHDLLIENSDFSYNNTEFFNQEYDAAGIKITFSDNVTVHDSTLNYNNGSGFIADIGSDNLNLYRNFTRDNTIHGLFFEISNDADIVGNITLSNGDSGIRIGNSSNARILNNTMMNDGVPLKIYESERTPLGYEIGATFVTTNTVVRNNLVYASVPLLLPRMIDTGNYNCTTGGDPALMSQWNYNAYYRSSTSNPFPRKLIYWAQSGICNVAYDNVTLFRNATGFDGNSVERINVADPYLINFAAGDYNLQACSPANNAGNGLNTEQAAMLGVPANTTTDMGARQTSATCGSPTATPTRTSTPTNTPIVPGIVLSTSSITVTEGQPGVTYTIKLATAPQAGETVTVSFNPDASQVQTSITSLTFNNATWNTTQNITVTAVDDTLDETSPMSRTPAHTTSSNVGGSAYASLSRTISISIVDNDEPATATSTGTTGPSPTSTATATQTNTPVPPTATNTPVGPTATATGTPSLILSTSSITVTEGQPGVTYNLKLSSSPQSGETVTVSFNPDTSQLTTTGGPFLLTSANWNAGVNITVTAVNDTLDENSPMNRTPSHTASSSLGTSGYNGKTISLSISIIDNDDPAAATNTPTRTNTPVSATATPTATATGTPSLILSTSSITVTEGQPGVTYNLKLSSSPQSGETVTVSFNPDTSQLTTTGGPFLLTSANWNAGVNITVTAVNDTLDENSPMNRTPSHTASSSLGTSGYNGKTISLSISIIDNDDPTTATPMPPTATRTNTPMPPTATRTNTPTATQSGTANILFSPGIMSVTEGQATVNYAVSLGNAPQASEIVTVTITFDVSQMTISPTMLQFNSGNWNSPQMIVVSAVDNGTVENVMSRTPPHTASSSLGASSPYNGMVRNITVTLYDND